MLYRKMTGLIEIMDEWILSRFSMKFLNLTVKEQEVNVEGNDISGGELPSFPQSPSPPPSPR